MEFLWSEYGPDPRSFYSPALQKTAKNQLKWLSNFFKAKSEDGPPVILKIIPWSVYGLSLVRIEDVLTPQLCKKLFENVVFCKAGELNHLQSGPNSDHRHSMELSLI